jgi:hypothetical protein
MHRLDKWDKRVSAALHIPEVPGPVTKNLRRVVMRLLEYTGHGVPWLLFCAYGLLFLSDKYAYVIVNLLSALLLDLVVVGLIKSLARRKRPHYNKSECMSVCVGGGGVSPTPTHTHTHTHTHTYIHTLTHTHTHTHT